MSMANAMYVVGAIPLSTSIRPKGVYTYWWGTIAGQEVELAFGWICPVRVQVPKIMGNGVVATVNIDERTLVSD